MPRPATFSQERPRVQVEKTPKAVPGRKARRGSKSTTMMQGYSSPHVVVTPVSSPTVAFGGKTLHNYDELARRKAAGFASSLSDISPIPLPKKKAGSGETQKISKLLHQVRSKLDSDSIADAGGVSLLEAIREVGLVEEVAMGPVLDQ